MSRKTPPIALHRSPFGLSVKASDLDAKLNFGTGIGKDAEARTRFHIRVLHLVEGRDYILLPSDGKTDFLLSRSASKAITRSALRRWRPPERGSPRDKKLRALPKSVQRSTAVREIQNRKNAEQLYKFFR